VGITEFEESWGKYFAQRNAKDGIMLGRVFEAGLTLALAEQYRRIQNNGRVRELLNDAIAQMPGYAKLLSFEETWMMEKEIVWTEVLFDSRDSVDTNDV